jgi:hypothetical protein
MIVLGIDPGINMGVAIYANGKLSELKTVLPWQIVDELAKQQPGLVVFEDSRAQSHIWSAKNVSKAAQQKIARNVGQIDAWCTLLQAACSDKDIDCIGISPKDKGAKTNAKPFQDITGWRGLSNEHTRDAAMVAWQYRNGFGD